MEEVADIASDEKRCMLFDALGFLPDGDELDLYEGKRPDLRVKDLRNCAGAMVELVVRVVDARQRVTYHPGHGGNGRGGPGGYGGYGGAGGGSEDEEADPLDRAPDIASGGNGGAKYFYVFEDETGLLEGVGEAHCVTYGTPPVCFLRGEIRVDREGVPKITRCTFLRS